MLIARKKKEQLCNYLANVVLYFIHFNQKGGSLNHILEITGNPDSPGFIYFQEGLKEQFMNCLDEKEMESIFDEVLHLAKTRF